MTGKTVAKKQDQMPAFMQNDQAPRGSENVTIEDLTIPRVEIVQSLSPCRKKSDPNYIDDIEEGDLYNNVTREIYGTEIKVVPVLYRKSWNLWKDRNAGGGFRGSYPNAKEAKQGLIDHIAEVPEEDGKIDILDTPEHFILILKEDGSIEEAVISMPRTKAKVSRNWNSLIKISGADSFAKFYTMRSVEDQNSAGQDFYNVAIKAGTWVSEDQYKQAETLYAQVMSGERDVNRDVDEATTTDDETETDKDSSEEF